MEILTFLTLNLRLLDLPVKTAASGVCCFVRLNVIGASFSLIECVSGQPGMMDFSSLTHSSAEDSFVFEFV